MRIHVALTHEELGGHSYTTGCNFTKFSHLTSCLQFQDITLDCQGGMAWKHLPMKDFLNWHFEYISACMGLDEDFDKSVVL